MKEPKIGDKIYVPSSYHVYRGEDDFEGGLATISKIEYSDNLPKTHINYIMVAIEEQPSAKYNYKILIKKQSELKKRYKDEVAHPTPDLRPQFNQPDADWSTFDIINNNMIDSKLDAVGVCSQILEQECAKISTKKIK